MLTDDLCVRRTWKIRPQKELEQDNSIFFGSMAVSSVGLRTMYSTAERLAQWHGLRLLAASNAFACVLFFLCFPHRKGFHTQRFWLFRVGLCCGSWLLSPSHGHLASSASADLANSLRFMCSVQRKLCCSWSSALHRSTIKTDEKEVFLEVENTLGPLRS